MNTQTIIHIGKDFDNPSFINPFLNKLQKDMHIGILIIYVHEHIKGVYIHIIGVKDGFNSINYDDLPTIN